MAFLLFSKRDIHDIRCLPKYTSKVLLVLQDPFLSLVEGHCSLVRTWKTSTPLHLTSPSSKRTWEETPNGAAYRI
jgi:hypothetical protein